MTYQSNNPLSMLGAGSQAQLGAGALGGFDPQTLQILMALLAGPQFPGGAGSGVGSTGPGGFGAFPGRPAPGASPDMGGMKDSMKDIVAKLKAMNLSTGSYDTGGANAMNMNNAQAGLF